MSSAEPPLVIDRLTVEEGFLDDLELTFRPGLNVIIGPRGTGKTSVIELLRFCLKVPALTERFERAARDHAKSVLAGGRVTVAASADLDRVLVTRRANDEAPEGEVLPGGPPIVLSQNEIEAVGLDARGRLRIVDGFRRATSPLDERERGVVSGINSLSSEVTAILQELHSLQQQVAELPEARAALDGAERDAEEHQRSMEAAMPELAELDRLSTDSAKLAVRTAVLERTIEAVEAWGERLQDLVRGMPGLETWPDRTDQNDPIKHAATELSASRLKFDAGINEIGRAVSGLRARLRDEEGSARAGEDRARELRRRADTLREGAGAAARRLATLRERVAQLTALEDVLAERQTRLSERRQQRTAALSELEQVRQERYEQRVAVARSLTSALSPQIEVDIKRSGLAADYAQAIADALRGSGLHYNQLSPQVASRVAPHELVRAAEEGDEQLITDATGIPPDRAARVLDQIRAAGTAGILSAPVDDAASFKLLVGTEYRDTPHLSTGQRCTAVLPVLLHHAESPVIIDQPEDHLDTAFIVDTLVKAIRQRPSGSQLIVSTHNPNIPVLAEAAQVTVLGSDGKRGFELHTGELDDPEVVDAITTIMEGGREAFDRRAQFYRSHPG